MTLKFKIEWNGSFLVDIDFWIRLNLSANEALNLLPKLSLKGTALEASCVPPNEPCEDTKYRSIDGSCNNFFGPFWGKSGTSFTRFVPPQYGDGNYLTNV